jgi:hypothetical protein
VPGLRLLVRGAPWIVAAVAALVWLRRRTAARPQLAPPPEPPRALPPPPPSEPAGRFQRRPIDIVTVVDDLLDVGR